MDLEALKVELEILIKRMDDYNDAAKKWDQDFKHFKDRTESEMEDMWDTIDLIRGHLIV